MDLNAGLNHPGMPPALGLLVMLLGVYVSIDMGQRVRRRNPGERLPWLLAAAVALSTGLWAAAVLGVADLHCRRRSSPSTPAWPARPHWPPWRWACRACTGRNHRPLRARNDWPAQ